MIKRCLVAAIAWAFSIAAHAEPTGVSATGFTSTFSREVNASRSQAFEAIGQIEQWWNGQHSYSGKASNLRLGLRSGDCFCEAWDGNSIEHARVIYVQKDSTIRLQGGLGPLQAMPVIGVLTFTTGTTDGKTVVKLVYRVSGPPDLGLDKLAPVVDRVMGEQFNRLVAHVESAKP
jgi:hypothetical protein